MHKKRRKAYRNLINALLNSNKREKWQLLEEHSKLLDAHFIKLLKKVAEELEKKRDKEGADFLCYLADSLVYQNIIAQLLNCASDEQAWQILNANLELVDLGLVQMMIQAAEVLEEEGNPNRAIFLSDLVLQLTELLEVSGNVAADNFSLIAKIKEYHNFLTQVLRSTSDSKGDPGGVYSLLQRNLDKLDEYLARMLQGWGTRNLAKLESKQANEIATVIVRLSNLIQQFPPGSRLLKLEIAITGYEIALQVLTRQDFPVDWAKVKFNLGNAYCQLINEENLEQAIACFLDALKIFIWEDSPVDWAMTQNSLGNAYCERIKEDKEENLELAIICYRKALEVYTRQDFPVDWAKVKCNLGVAYRNRIKEDREENLELAIICFRKALRIHTRRDFPVDWAMSQDNLGNAYCERIKEDREENLELAIICYRKALEVYTRQDFPKNWAKTQNNLGVAYHNRNKEDKASSKQAIACFRKALEVYTRQDFPQDCLTTRRNFGNLYFIQENWQEAIQNYQIAIEILEDTRLLSIDQNRKQEIIAENIGVFGNIIHCYIQLEQYDKAIECLEITKTRNLVELIATRDLYPKGDIPQETLTEPEPEFKLSQKVEPITFDQIQKLTDANTAIIQWCITEERIFTFITTENREQPLLKSFYSQNEFFNQIEKYMNLYLGNKQDWQSELFSLLRKFAQILHLEEIIDPLKEEYNKIILIPHLYLHLLPLHALPLDDDKCLLDHFEEVKYAPSCQLLQFIQKRQRRESNKFFGIQNPTEDLFYTDFEVEIIGKIFQPHDDILPRKEATKTSLNTKNLQDKHYSHFSCHGYFNFTEPLKSALILSGAVVKQEGNGALSDKQNVIPPPEKTIRSPEGENLDLEKCLTLEDIFELDLRQCHLVTLSACETAIIDTKSTSDEYISLPSGFLFAGACNVVATQWTVNDLSTAILMIRFYQLHKIDRLPVAKAMNEAQKWLRDGTQEVFWKWTEQLKNDLKLKQNIIQKIQDYLEIFDPEEKLFTEHFYWATFCAIGK